MRIFREWKYMGTPHVGFSLSTKSLHLDLWILMVNFQWSHSRFGPYVDIGCLWIGDIIIGVRGVLIRTTNHHLPAVYVRRYHKLFQQGRESYEVCR